MHGTGSHCVAETDRFERQRELTRNFVQVNNLQEKTGTRKGAIMFEGETVNEPRTAAESYLSATGSSNLRSVKDQSGALEVVGAAGMNPYQTGILLMRLQSEWDRAAKPKTPLKADFERISKTLDIVPAGRPNAGLAIETIDGTVHYRKPLELAERTAIAWHLHELTTLASHLKTLPEVRSLLERWIGGPHAARLVADILAWWLQPRCPYCRGCGKRVVEGTGGRSSGKPCWACRLSPVPGERPLPHASLGRKLLGHIRSCCGMASADQRQQHQEQRSSVAEDNRQRAKKDRQIDKLRRADEEAKRDDQQDRAAVAAHFAKPGLRT